MIVPGAACEAIDSGADIEELHGITAWNNPEEKNLASRPDSLSAVYGFRLPRRKRNINSIRR